MPPDYPRFRDLPTRGTVDHAAWGLWGDDDQVGRFNLQTPERVVDAARLVKKGALFPLNWKLEEPGPPIYGRGELRHGITAFPPDEWGHDDWYENFYPQASSQWDGLIHVGVGGGVFYNGVPKAEITGQPGTKLGIENWARRGIAGRAVFIDFIRWYEAQNGPLARNHTYLISPDELEAARQAQGVEVRQGDVLLIRTGWMEWYEAQGPEVRLAVAQPHATRFPGLESTLRMAEYLWDLGVCAVASDNPALESEPGRGQRAEDDTVFLHYYLLGRFGMAIGEMFYLEALSADCVADGVYEGFFTSAPLNKLGGAGSPPNALFIK